MIGRDPGRQAEYARRRAKKRRATLHAAVYRRLNVSMRALHSWKNAVSARKRMRCLHELAENHWKARRCRGRVLPAWLAEVWAARRRRLQEARAVGWFQHKRLRKSIRAWTDAAEGARMRRHLAAAFSLQREDTLRNDTFRSWAGETRRLRMTRAVSAGRAAAAGTGRAPFTRHASLVKPAELTHLLLFLLLFCISLHPLKKKKTRESCGAPLRSLSHECEANTRVQSVSFNPRRAMNGIRHARRL